MHRNGRPLPGPGHRAENQTRQDRDPQAGPGLRLGIQRLDGLQRRTGRQLRGRNGRSPRGNGRIRSPAQRDADHRQEPTAPAAPARSPPNRRGSSCGATCTERRPRRCPKAGGPADREARQNLDLRRMARRRLRRTTTPTCTVTMDAAEAIDAVYSGTPKTITPAEALTLTKAGSGFGTVKASGLSCEVLCGSTRSSTRARSPCRNPNRARRSSSPAPLRPAPSRSSGRACDEITVENKCVVTMEEAENVTATFDELE